MCCCPTIINLSVLVASQSPRWITESMDIKFTKMLMDCSVPISFSLTCLGVFTQYCPLLCVLCVHCVLRSSWLWLLFEMSSLWIHQITLTDFSLTPTPLPPNPYYHFWLFCSFVSTKNIYCPRIQTKFKAAWRRTLLREKQMPAI